MLERVRSTKLVLLLLAGCGAPAAPPEVAPTIATQQPTPPPPPPSLAPWAGRYQLSGQTVEDGCGGEIVLRAAAIEVDAAARALRADIVERDYTATVEDDHLVATGRFDVTNGCPESTVFERWDLARAGDGALEGELRSTWLIWPSCMRVCTVRFAVRAEPQ